MKFLTSNTKIQACPNCKHWFGIKTKKRFIRKENYWLFSIVCNSCGLKTEEFRLIEQVKFDWNKVKFRDIGRGRDITMPPKE